MLKSLLTLFYKLSLLVISLFVYLNTSYATEVFTIDNKSVNHNILVQLKDGAILSSDKNSFEIIKQLGQGRDATVYLARDIQSEQLKAIRLPRLFFNNSANNVSVDTYSDLYSKQYIDTKFFLPINDIIMLKTQQGSFQSPALIMPYAEGQFKISSDAELDRYTKIGPMLNDVLPHLFRLQAQGVKFNDLMLRNIVRYSGRHYVIDYDRVTTSVESSRPGVDYVAPEFFLNKTLHITSDLFGLSLSIANYLYNKNYDFRFHNYGFSPIERDIERGNAEFTEFYEQFYFKKSFEPETFIKNKQHLLTSIRNRAEDLKSKLPIGSYNSIQLVIDFLDSSLRLDTSERLTKIQAMSVKYNISTHAFFCRALF